MQTILLVDDEPMFVESLTDDYAGFLSGYRILTASNGEEAVARLAAERVDLVLTDLKMPKMDGFALIAHLHDHYPEIPVIVMSAFATPDDEQEIRRAGLRFMSKPINLPHLSAAVDDELASHSQGFLKGVSLASFLQLLEMERKTCTLRVVSGERSGMLHFRGGKLQSAQAGPLSGDAAALAILSWPDARMSLEPIKPHGKDVVSPLSFLVLQAAREVDESARDGRAGDVAEKSPEPFAFEEEESSLDGWYAASAAPAVEEEEDEGDIGDLFGKASPTAPAAKTPSSPAGGGGGLDDLFTRPKK